MELSLESLGGALATFQPRTGTLEAWNAAYVRVEDYLRAHRIHNRLHQSRLILRILERAARRHEENPELDPTTLAAEEAERLMDAWFNELLGDQNLPQDRVTIAGRVALLLTDGPEKFPYAFLDEDGVPPDFAHAMQQSSIEAGPDMAVSSMVPRPIDLGPITEAAGETMERFEKWPLLRALVLWLMFAAALAGIFFVTR
jgi:hypothetical protein